MHPSDSTASLPTFSNTGHQTTHMHSALIVDDEPGIRSFLQKGLSRHFGLVEVAGDTVAAGVNSDRSE